MNLEMAQPKTKTEDLFLPLTKNNEAPSEQIHTKPQQTLELKLTKPREKFLFNPTLSIEEAWMIGLKSVDFYNSIFNINYQNNKFELYTDTFDEVFSEELKSELEEIVNIANY